MKNESLIFNFSSSKCFLFDKKVTKKVVLLKRYYYLCGIVIDICLDLV